MVEIVYEDNHILVVVKPQNMPSQEDSSKDKDLLTLLKEYIKEKYNKPGNVYLGLVHRLDRPTGGVMIFAKTSKAAARLSMQIKDNVFIKKYYACLVGMPRMAEGRLEHYLLKDSKNNVVTIVPQTLPGAKKAILDYKILEVYEKQISLAEVTLTTGRSHQIRVQMASMGTPIFGDIKYKGKIVNNTNLALWAYELTIAHPITNQKMTFKVMPNLMQLPWKYFEKIIQKNNLNKS